MKVQLKVFIVSNTDKDCLFFEGEIDEVFQTLDKYLVWKKGNIYGSIELSKVSDFYVKIV